MPTPPTRPLTKVEKVEQLIFNRHPSLEPVLYKICGEGRSLKFLRDLLQLLDDANDDKAVMRELREEKKVRDGTTRLGNNLLPRHLKSVREKFGLPNPDPGADLGSRPGASRKERNKPVIDDDTESLSRSSSPDPPATIPDDVVPRVVLDSASEADVGTAATKKRKASDDRTSSGNPEKRRMVAETPTPQSSIPSTVGIIEGQTLPKSGNPPPPSDVANAASPARRDGMAIYPAGNSPLPTPSVAAEGSVSAASAEVRASAPGVPVKRAPEPSRPRSPSMSTLPTDTPSNNVTTPPCRTSMTNNKQSTQTPIPIDITTSPNGSTAGSEKCGADDPPPLQRAATGGTPSKEFTLTYAIWSMQPDQRVSGLAIETVLNSLNPTPSIIYIIDSCTLVDPADPSAIHGKRLPRDLTVEHHTIVVPLFIAGNHWGVAVVRRHDRQVLIYEPRRCTSFVRMCKAAMSEFVVRLDRANRAITTTAADWDIRPDDSGPTQAASDVYSCGVLVLVYGIHTMLSRATPEKVSIEVWRHIFAAVLCTSPHEEVDRGMRKLPQHIPSHLDGTLAQEIAYPVADKIGLALTDTDRTIRSHETHLAELARAQDLLGRIEKIAKKHTVDVVQRQLQAIRQAQQQLLTFRQFLTPRTYHAIQQVEISSNVSLPRQWVVLQGWVKTSQEVLRGRLRNARSTKDDVLRRLSQWIRMANNELGAALGRNDPSFEQEKQAILMHLKELSAKAASTPAKRALFNFAAQWISKAKPGVVGSLDDLHGNANVQIYHSTDAELLQALDGGCRLRAPVLLRERKPEWTMPILEYTERLRLVADQVSAQGDNGPVSMSVDHAVKAILAGTGNDTSPGRPVRSANLLDLKDYAKRQKPMFLQAQRLQLLATLDAQEQNGWGNAGKETLERTIDVSSCNAFNLLASATSFTRPHVDSLGGTWVRCLQGIKAWPYVVNPDGAEEAAFLRDGGTWVPDTQDVIMPILRAGDVLYMPPGVTIIHAPFTMETCLMDGGMTWDSLTIIETLRHIQRVAEYPSITNEPFQLQLAPLLKGLSDRRDQYYRDDESMQDSLRAAIWDLEKLIGCECSHGETRDWGGKSQKPRCTAQCKCTVAKRRCTDLCKDHAGIAADGRCKADPAT